MLSLICFVADTQKNQMVQFCKLLNALSTLILKQPCISQVYAQEMQINMKIGI